MRSVSCLALWLLAGLPAQSGVPDGLVSTRFCGPDVTPSPACLAAAPTGEVFVGVDLNGSLGKGPGKGRIVRLVDRDGDGAADGHTVFAEVDNPRGLMPVGKRLFVLHTEIPADTGILTGLHLSVLEDADGDGVADGPPQRLVSDLSVPKHNQERGADHTTNGIRLGIDGWIYIAVGDFGMVNATGSDGRQLTMLGGGVVRVRPDGAEMEVYTHGLRNIYDVAIDPFLNLFTRGNTNDGGGWNVRFIHHLQTGEYGYPVLFQRFTKEILPALADLGGGSGTGALFLSEPGWPARWNDVPLLCDWGRSVVYAHRVAPDGASFRQEPEEFLRVSQVSDLDVDGSGRLYVAAWDGAGYTGDPRKGFVERVVPAGWSARPFPGLENAEGKALLALLASESATARLHAQQELLRRGAGEDTAGILALAQDPARPRAARVAALFTWKQLRGAAAAPDLLQLAADPGLREFALRALADRLGEVAAVPLDPFLQGLRDADARVQAAAAVGLGRLGRTEAAPALLAAARPPESMAEEPAAPASAPAYVSPVVSGGETVDIGVDITGFRELCLAVGEGTDGSGSDHAAWFEPEIVLADGTVRRLTDISWKAASQGWGETLVNAACTGRPLRAAGREEVEFGIGTHAPSLIVYDLPENAVRFRARGGISSSARGGGSVEFSVSSAPPAALEEEGPHAAPNAAVIVPHLAVRALVALRAVEPCLAALGGPDEEGALWALRSLHDRRVVEGLIAACEEATEAGRRAGILTVLARLYHREAPYDGSWWWGTRPDSRGPYSRPEAWEGTAAIDAYLKDRWNRDLPGERPLLAALVEKHRLGLQEMRLGAAPTETPASERASVDLAGIAAGEGEVGSLSIEDVILALGKTPGDPARGKELFTRQGCVACHTLEKGQPLKGPYMGHIGSIMNREQIAESILKPSASISQGFATVQVTTRDGGAFVGFVSAETAEELEIRDITGAVSRVPAAEVATRTEVEVSMMPPGLANALSLEEFACLVRFLEERKE